MCLVLTFLVFSQSSGRVALDTKLDLIASPLRFLAKATSLWDPLGSSGQLQNQAYGYLFPMGPFYAAGYLANLDPWVVQRLWESSLVVMAFLGTYRLARALGVRGFWIPVATGLAYGLAPRMLTEIGAISAEIMPMAALPWILAPLVRGACEGSPRRAAAMSGIALLFAGGVNAAATVAVLPVAGIWLLTRERTARSWALIRWWAVAVVAAVLWWAIPLVLLARYSPPFLDWIETSSVTTRATNLIDTLRGTDHWIPLLGPSGWPAGWILLSAPAAIIATTAVAALGLYGIGLRRTPHRTFLVTALVVGVLLVTMGYVARVGPLLGETVGGLLDGPLNAFRNVHKFDPVVRLPLVLGAGFGLAEILSRTPRRNIVRRARGAILYPRAIAIALVIGIGAVAISPALAGRVVAESREVIYPQWWDDTANWLAKHAGTGRALIVPSAFQPSYVWGNPGDEPMQPLASTPWAVRDSVPLGQAGYIRFLDVVEQRLRAGVADFELASLLARAGIRYLVVRNDLDTTASVTTPVFFVHQTLLSSPGFTEVVRFGADLDPQENPNLLRDLGATQSRGAVTVYENSAWVGQVSLQPASQTVVSNGATDVLPDLIAAGMPVSRPVLFGPAGSTAVQDPALSTTVLTEGARKREVPFAGTVRFSPTLTEYAAYQASRRVYDYLPSPQTPLSYYRYQGIVGVQASSAASQLSAFYYRGVNSSPWAAIDGDPATSWRSGSVQGAAGQWLQVDLINSVDRPELKVAFVGDLDRYPSKVRVTTDTGSRDVEVTPSAALQSVSAPDGQTQSVRITVLETSASSTGDASPVVGISDLLIDDVVPSRTLVIPGKQAPDVITFSPPEGSRGTCLTIGGAPACDSSWLLGGEEPGALDRTFTMDRSITYDAAATVRLKPGSLLNALLDKGNPIQATASSLDSPDPRQRAGAAVDGSSSTGWVAAQGDRTPTISLRLQAPRSIDGLIITTATNAPTAAPLEVKVTAGAASFTLDVPKSGRIDLPRSVRTDRLVVEVTKSSLRISTDTSTDIAHQLPLGIGEIRLLGDKAPDAEPTGTIVIGCRSGPQLVLDDVLSRLSIEAPVTDVLAGRPVQATLCKSAPVTFGAGTHRTQLLGGSYAAPDSLRFLKSGTANSLLSSTWLTPVDVASPGQVRADEWGATRRTVTVSTSEPSILLVRENANLGWKAQLDGEDLTSVVIDGWQQGWQLPGGATGQVTLRFTPQSTVNAGLVVGLVAVGALIACAVRRDTADAARAAPSRDAVWSKRVALALSGLTLILLGGLVGAGVAAVTLAVGILSQRVRLDLSAWVAPALLLLAGGWEALHPFGSLDPGAGRPVAQTLCLAALGALLVRFLTPPAVSEPTQ